MKASAQARDALGAAHALDDPSTSARGRPLLRISCVVVTFEESIEALGLSERLASREKGPLTQAEVRAAYVALIKVHKPERDPEGFRKVREAYEQAQQDLQWQALVTDTSRGDGAFGSAQSVPFAAAHWPPEADAEARAEQVAEAEAQAARNAAINAAYEAIACAKDNAARITALRKAMADYPGEASFRWQLLDVYDATEQTALGDALVREGVELDLPGFLETYALQSPERVTAAQRDMLRTRNASLAVMRVCIAQKLRTELDEALRSAMEEGHGKKPRMPYVELALFALEREDVVSAERVLRVLKEHDTQFAIESRAQVAELLTRDLLLLRDGLPHTYLRALIEGVRLGRANQEVASFRSNDPERAREVFDLLRGHSLALSKLYERLLAPPVEARAPLPVKTNWHWGWVLLAVGLVRACMAANRNNNSNASSSYALQRALDTRIEERQEQWPQEESRGYEDELAERLSALDRHAPEPAESESSESSFVDSSPHTEEQVHAAVMVICQEAGTHCEAAELLARNAQQGHCDLTAATEFAQDTRGLSPAQEFLLVRQAALAACVLDTAQP